MSARATSRKAAWGLALSAFACILPLAGLAVLTLPVGIAGLLLAVVGLENIRGSQGRLRGRWLAVVAILGQAALFSASLILVPCSYVMKAQRRAKCRHQLKALAAAMHEHLDDHGTLPPYAIYGEDGAPLLSWRVLLLGEGDLYEEFHLDEPWDGPHNARLLARRPATYAAPGVWPGGGPHGTFYRVFVGPGAAFEGRKGLRLPRDFPDGPSNTILVVEAGQAVPWTSPEDLSFEPDRPLPELGGLGFDHGFMAAFADGSVRIIPRTTSEATLRAAVTRNGEQPLRDDADW